MTRVLRFGLATESACAPSCSVVCAFDGRSDVCLCLCTRCACAQVVWFVSSDQPTLREQLREYPPPPTSALRNIPIHPRLPRRKLLKMRKLPLQLRFPLIAASGVPRLPVRWAGRGQGVRAAGCAGSLRRQAFCGKTRRSHARPPSACRYVGGLTACALHASPVVRLVWCTPCVKKMLNACRVVERLRARRRLLPTVTAAAAQIALADLWLLGECDALVATSGSTFGQPQHLLAGLQSRTHMP